MHGKKKKIYLGIIGIGLLALIVDRMIGPPAPTAAETPDPAATVAAAESADAPDGPLSVMVTPFPKDLAAAAPGTVRDPFLVPGSVLASLNPPPTPQDAQAADDGRTIRHVHFSERHELSAVVHVGKTRIAVIDGLSVSPGQQLDECTLIDLEPRSARFACPQGEIVLTLDGAVLEAPVN